MSFIIPILLLFLFHMVPILIGNNYMFLNLNCLNISIIYIIILHNISIGKREYLKIKKNIFYFLSNRLFSN